MKKWLPIYGFSSITDEEAVIYSQNPFYILYHILICAGSFIGTFELLRHLLKVLF